MNWWLILIPVIGAVVGFICNKIMLNKIINQVLPSKQPAIAAQAGKAAAEMVPFDALEQKIAGPESMDKIMPSVEGHIDHFLRNKLAIAFPMISMFIGEKTINQLKEIFMKEMQEIFPQLMKQFAGNLRSELNIEKMVSEKIASFPPEKLKAAIHQQLGNDLRKFEMAGAVTGLIIGIVQVLITLLIA